MSKNVELNITVEGRSFKISSTTDALFEIADIHPALGKELIGASIGRGPVLADEETEILRRELSELRKENARLRTGVDSEPEYTATGRRKKRSYQRQNINQVCKLRSDNPHHPPTKMHRVFEDLSMIYQKRFFTYGNFVEVMRALGHGTDMCSKYLKAETVIKVEVTHDKLAEGALHDGLPEVTDLLEIKSEKEGATV